MKTLLSKDHSQQSLLYLACKQSSIGIDYLRVTRPLSSRSTNWRSTFEAIRRDEMYAGYLKSKPIRLVTMKGELQGRVAYLCSETHECIQLSSALADDYWYHFVTESEAKVTRIDLRLDIDFNDDTPNFARRLRIMTMRYWKAKLESLGYSSPVLVTQNGGDTLYLGARSSGRFMRIYDKKRESKLEENRWRAELELKSDMAHITTQAILSSKGNWPQMIQSQVLSGLAAWGVSVEDLERQYPLVSAGTKPKSDVERQLLWLSKQVGPTVETLLKHGYVDEVLAALGLVSLDSLEQD